MGRIWLFPLLFQNDCSHSSRFLPQARRIVGSGDENGLVPSWYLKIDDSPSIKKHIDLRQAQKLDPRVLSRVVHLIETGKRPSVKVNKGESREAQRMFETKTSCDETMTATATHHYHSALSDVISGFPPS